MDINAIIRDIRKDPGIRSREIILVLLNQECHAKLEDAFLLSAAGDLQKVFWETSSDGKRADEAEIRLTEDGTCLVSFHETRPNSKNHRPNGIQVQHEELDVPCAAFCNTGKERLTVDGEWVEPGGYVLVQEQDINDPEVQKALAELTSSPEVQEYIRKVQREYAEKMREKRA